MTERIRELILTPTLTEDERELLEEWLEECSEDEFDEYLRLRGGEEEGKLSHPPQYSTQSR